MRQEDKELLFKDICGRLPYGVKIQARGIIKFFGDEEVTDEPWILTDINIKLNTYGADTTMGISLFNRKGECNFKPYLFPLSSMTEEQKKEINKRYINSIDDYSISIKYHSDGYWDDDTDAGFSDYLWLINWFNKNHFDYQGLIKKGLAIDATNLNIY